MFLFSKYGVFWAFSTGEDVASEWLQFAQEANGDRRAFAERVLLHVGFSQQDINSSRSKRWHMVVFDLDDMDSAWREVDGHQSFQATWDNMFEYLGGVYTACHSESDTTNTCDGTPEVDGDSCDCKVFEGAVMISAEAQTALKTRTWAELTSCADEGYPGHPDLLRDSVDIYKLSTHYLHPAISSNYYCV